MTQLRIFGWAGDTSGCGYYRLRMPFHFLEQQGHSTRVLTQKPGYLNISNDMRFEDEPVNVIVGQRIVIPEMLAIWRRMRKFAPLVHELDDNLFHIDRRNMQAAHLYSHQSVRDTLRHSTWMSDLVTVSTQPLADEMIEECNIDPNKVVVVPNRVHPMLFDIERPHRDRLVVGWAGGGSHDGDFDEIASVLRAFLAERPDIDFHSLGHDYRRALRKPNVRLTRWIDSIETYWRTIDFDIALAPLVHNRFNASKSALRALENGALGIPVIASDEPPYREVIVHGETGFLADSSWKWRKYLRELVNDAELREQMGKAARERVKAHWSIADGWIDWERAYMRVVKGAS